MRRLALALSIIIGLYWLFLFLFQRSILFPLSSHPMVLTRPADAEQVWLSIPAGLVEAWFLPPMKATAGPVPLILFAHGNGEVIDLWPPHFAEPRRWGFALLLVEYPGYGRSGGSPSRESIRQAFEAAYGWATSQTTIDVQRIVFYGRSLGTGAVGDLCSQHPPAALVFESGFTRTADFAWRLLAPPFLVRDRFDNLAAIQAFHGPKLVLHGDRDEVIPTEHGQQLAAAAGVPLVLMPCGHNDCPRPWSAVHEFLKQAGLLPDSARPAI